MNRIVREHYPVSKLPEDLRDGFEDQDFVNVIVDATDTLRQPASTVDEIAWPRPEENGEQSQFGGQFLKFRHLRRSNYRTIEEINDYVSGLRDEWAHRER